MDYSSHMHDGDNPAEPSPWGSSPTTSPRQSRTIYGHSASDLPSSPSPYRDHLHTSSNGNYINNQDSVSSGDFNKPDNPNLTSVVEPDGGNETPEIADLAPTSSEQSFVGQHQSRQRQQQEQYSQQKQQPGQSRQDAQRYQSSTRQSSRTQGSQFKLQAKITGLERTGRKDPILRFDVHTNLQSFRTTQFRDVRRTYSEFVKLADHLISSNPEAIVPAVPPPLTSAGAGTDEDEARVKGSMQRWLTYVCSNEVLMRDDEMVLFVESDFGYSPMVKRKQPATGVIRKVIKQFAPPPDDTPELQDARPIIKLFYLGTMDTGHKVDKLVKARRGLGLAESEFGVKLGSMNVQEPHQGLSNAYRKLGKTIQVVGDFHAAQATAEATTIGDPLQYHSEDAFIVKETLTNRHILMRDLHQAQQLSLSKHQAAERLKSSSSVKREKVDEAISALEEARSNELHLLSKTQRVTANLLLEARTWTTRTTTDLRLSIREYVLREIEAERRALATLETIRPDIRAIDASGGLSRLGRETHPAARRASLAASQGPKGDSWSGVPRRADGISRLMSSSFVSESVEDEHGQGMAGTKVASGSGAGVLKAVKEEDDEDRVDAKNAASRLATSTF